MTSLPKISPSNHPRYAFEVTAPAATTGKRIRKYFKTKAQATAFHRDLTARLSKHGALALDKEEHLLIARYRDRLTLNEMEEAFRQALTLKDQTTLTLSGLLNEFQTHMDHAHRAGAIGDLHLRDIDTRCPQIDKALGHHTLSALDRPTIQDWIDSLTCAPRTKTNFLRILRQAINYGITHDHLPKDPSLGVFCPAHKPTVHILTPEDWSRLLDQAASRNDDLTWWWLLLGGAAGLRTSEVERLDWSDFRPAEQQLYVRPGKTPNAERWIDFTPPLRLVDWSQLPSAGPVLRGTHERTRQTHRQRTYAAAGVTVPNNALRHSFGSHHLVHFSDPNRTALQMGHATPQQTFNAYRKAVTTAQAKAWWEVDPGKGVWHTSDQ